MYFDLFLEAELQKKLWGLAAALRKTAVFILGTGLTICAWLGNAEEDLFPQSQLWPCILCQTCWERSWNSFLQTTWNISKTPIHTPSTTRTQTDLLEEAGHSECHRSEVVQISTIHIWRPTVVLLIAATTPIHWTTTSKQAVVIFGALGAEWLKLAWASTSSVCKPTNHRPCEDKTDV